MTPTQTDRLEPGHIVHLEWTNKYGTHCGDTFYVPFNDENPTRHRRMGALWVQGLVGLRVGQGTELTIYASFFDRQTAVVFVQGIELFEEQARAA